MNLPYDPFGGAAKTSNAPEIEATSGTLPASPFATATAIANTMESQAIDDRSLFLHFLHDEEFEGGVADLIRYGEMADESRLLEGETTHGIRQEIELLVGELEDFVDGIATTLDEAEVDTMDPVSFESFVDDYRPDFEYGIFKRIKRGVRNLGEKARNSISKLAKGAKKVAKGVRNKAKKVGRKIVDTARKSVANAKGALGNIGKWAKSLGLKKLLQLILRRLKGKIGPFIQLAMCAAMNKVPKKLRPHARKLKKRVEAWLEKREIEGEALFTPETVPLDPSELAADLDERLVDLVYGNFEDEASAAQYTRLPETATLAPNHETLVNARQRFVDEVTDPAVEDYGPPVEAFMGTVWPALKGAVVVGGHKRVRNLIARKLVKPLIGKLFSKGGRSGRKLAKTVAPPLAQVITGAGMRLMGFELSEEDELDAAGQMIASTVEDMTRRLAATPGYLMEDEATAEGLSLEAFEAAAAANLPGILPEEVYEARPELREARRNHGCWLALPLKSQRGRKPPRYRKYSVTPEVMIDEEATRRMRVGCGRPLHHVLARRLRRVPSRLRARAHLFETMVGTTDARIEAHESVNFPEEDEFELLPLTREAADMLLGEPEVGRRVAHRHGCHRRRTAVGQRFFALELLDQEASVHLDDEVEVRTSETNLVLDFGGRRVTVNLFLDEATIDSIADHLMGPGGSAHAISALRRDIGDSLARVVSGNHPGHARILHPALDADEARGEAFGWLPRKATEAMLQKLTEWVEKALERLFREDPNLVRNVAQADAFGATFTVQITRMENLGPIYRALEGQPVRLHTLAFGHAATEPLVSIVPGFRRD